MQTPGLPRYGDIWYFNETNTQDVDVWAFCKMPISLEPKPGQDDGEPAREWLVGFVFSTKSESKRCHEEQIEDPLLIPDRVSGGLIKFTEEATVDRFGKPITTSSHEQIRGSAVEFDNNRDTIRIEQNVPELELPLLVSLRDGVNDEVLWGFPPRCVKLSSYTWEKKYYGRCEVYYTRSLEFETSPTGFDRDLLDEGTKVLNGHWNDVVGTGTDADADWVLDPVNGATPDPANPTHFIRYKDRNGENAKVILNGAGLPAGAALQQDGPYFVAINPSGLSNVGNPLSNSRWWRRVKGDPSTAVAWSEFQTYAAGDVVSPGYIAMYKNGDTSYSYDPTLYPNMWKNVGSFSYAGVYSPTASYSVGQYVTPQVTPTEAGYIHVEKYASVNFLLLGIPTTL